MSTPTTHRISRGVGLLLAVAAAAAPAAQADGPFVSTPDSVDRNAAAKAAPAVIVQSPDSVDRNAAARAGLVIDKVTPDARDSATPRVTVQPVVESVTASDGMDWGDVAIGAGGALGIILLASGAAVTVTRHRHGHHPA